MIDIVVVRWILVVVGVIAVAFSTPPGVIFLAKLVNQPLDGLMESGTGGPMEWIATALGVYSRVKDFKSKS